MTLLKIHSQKWLSEVELLDSDMEPSEFLKPANIEIFFAGITDSKARENMKSGILDEISQGLEKNCFLVFISNASTIFMVNIAKSSNG